MSDVLLTSAFLAELKKGSNTPDTFLEVALDSGVKRYGFNRGPSINISDGLFALYHLDNDWLDAVGSADGTASGALFNTADAKFGAACGSFNGTSDNVNMGNIGSSDVLSFSVWFKPSIAVTSASSTQDIIRFGNLGGLPYLLGIGSFTSDLTDEIISVYTRDSLNLPAPHGWIDNSFTIDTSWHHISCVWNSAVGMYDIYFDGDSKPITNNTSGRIALPVIANNFSLGQGLSVSYFGGLIDEVALWTRTLSSLEVSKLYEAGRGLVLDSVKAEIIPILGSVTSQQNKLDTKKAYSTRGSLQVVIKGRDNFKSLISDEYLKNRRVTRKDGFVAEGYAYSDFAPTFTGLISNWERKGDELTITVTDDTAEGQKKIPVPNLTKTQVIDYSNGGAGMNPADIMQDILKNQLGIDSAYVDDITFDSEQDTWLNNWRFSRILTEPKDANKYLNELQIETNSFIIHHGDKISFRVFAPPVPGSTIEKWVDNFNILKDSLSMKSGYLEHFYNRVDYYYDYDESGSDNEVNFESIVIDNDSNSQSSGVWGETKTKVVKARWTRTFSNGQPTTITGVIVKHTSLKNGAGNGTLAFIYNAAGEHTLQWTPPIGSIGPTVVISKDGEFQVFSSDESKYIRVVITNLDLATSSKSDTIVITSLNGLGYATAIARKILSKYRDPSANVAFDVDINNVSYNSVFLKPTDFKYITTDEAFGKGKSSYTNELIMLTSVRPDFSNNKVRIEAIQAKMERNYGFIAPSGQPDWDSASASEKEYAYIGDVANNQLGAANDKGFSIW